MSTKKIKSAQPSKIEKKSGTNITGDDLKRADMVKMLFSETRQNIDILLNIIATNTTDTAIGIAAKDELRAHLDILTDLRKSFLPRITKSSDAPIPVEDQTDIRHRWV